MIKLTKDNDEMHYERGILLSSGLAMRFNYTQNPAERGYYSTTSPYYPFPASLLSNVVKTDAGKTLFISVSAKWV